MAVRHSGAPTAGPPGEQSAGVDVLIDVLTEGGVALGLGDDEPVPSGREQPISVVAAAADAPNRKDLRVRRWSATLSPPGPGEDEGLRRYRALLGTATGRVASPEMSSKGLRCLTGK